jgi:hypothetical protein
MATPTQPQPKVSQEQIERLARGEYAPATTADDAARKAQQQAREDAAEFARHVREGQVKKNGG